MSVIARIERYAGGGDVGGVVSVVRAGTGYTYGWALHVLYPDGNVELYRRGLGSAEHVATTPPTTADEPHSIAATYDGSLIRVYVDGVLAGSLADTEDLEASTSGAYTVSVGGYNFESDDWRPFYGVIDEVAVFGVGPHRHGHGRPRTHSPKAKRHRPAGCPRPATTASRSGRHPAPRSNTATATPKKTRRTGPAAFAGTPSTRAAGIYQPTSNTSSSTTRSPGRFDVPPRKWTRVPFNTVRIQRRWELDSRRRLHRRLARPTTAASPNTPKTVCCSSPPG